MSIDQENVFNDQQNDNGVFAVDDNDRPASSKKEPSKSKNSKILIYSMLGIFVVAILGVGTMMVSKFIKGNKPHNDMVISAGNEGVNNTDIIESAKPVNVPAAKPIEPVKKEVLVTTTPSMPNAIVDINSLPAEKREVSEVKQADFEELKQRVTTLENMYRTQTEKLNQLDAKYTAAQSGNNSKLTNTASIKKTDTYIPKKRVVKHKKEVVDESILFEASPAPAQVKATPNPPSTERVRGEYKLKAIVEDRVWLEDPQGNTVTVTQGDPVSGLGNLTAVDEHDFKVRFSSGTTLKGQ